MYRYDCFWCKVSYTVYSCTIWCQYSVYSKIKLYLVVLTCQNLRRYRLTSTTTIMPICFWIQIVVCVCMHGCFSQIQHPLRYSDPKWIFGLQWRDLHVSRLPYSTVIVTILLVSLALTLLLWILKYKAKLAEFYPYTMISESSCPKVKPGYKLLHNSCRTLSHFRGFCRYKRHQFVLNIFQWSYLVQGSSTSNSNNLIIWCLL